MYHNEAIFLFSISVNVIILIIQGVSYKYSSLNSNFLELAHIVTGAVIILEVLATIPVIICYIGKFVFSIIVISTN